MTSEQYIVREGGGRRVVVKGEFNGKNYQQLLHSEAPGQGRRWWFFPLLALNLIVLVAIIGLVYRRYLRRQKRA